MGNDGGYIAKRVDLVKNKRKEIKFDNIMKAKNRSKLCKISKEKLKKPIVMCRIGNLYNYEVVLTHMMNKTLPKQFSHIKKIKSDVKQVNITENEDKNSEYPFICSLSKMDFNGINKFCGLWSCGCVFSAQLIKNISDKKCPVCTKEYSSSDLIDLTMDDDKQQEIQQVLISKQKKKDKKKEDKKQKEEDKDKDKDDHEPKVVKKVKIDNSVMLQKPKMNLIEKISAQEDIKTQNSEVYKSLFHKNEDKEFKEDYQNLMFRNTRHGIR